MKWPIVKQDVINGKIVVTYFHPHKTWTGQDAWFKSQIFVDGGSALVRVHEMSGGNFNHLFNHQSLCVLARSMT